MLALQISFLTLRYLNCAVLGSFGAALDVVFCNPSAFYTCLKHHIGSIHAALDRHCTTLDLNLHCKSSFQSHKLFTTAPAPLEIVLYTEAQVRNAIEQLKSAPAYVEVLRLEQAPIPAIHLSQHSQSRN